MLPLCALYPQVAGAGGVYGQKGEKGEPAVIEPVIIRTFYERVPIWHVPVTRSKVVQCSKSLNAKGLFFPMQVYVTPPSSCWCADFFFLSISFSKGMLIEGPPGPSGPAVGLLSTKNNEWTYFVFVSKQIFLVTFTKEQRRNYDFSFAFFFLKGSSWSCWPSRTPRHRWRSWWEGECPFIPFLAV